MSGTHIEMHAIIRGDVQGVGFRATAKQQAIQLGLVGTARNLADGSVELHLVGTPPKIELLLKNLSGPQGPGSVTEVITKEISPPHSYPNFHILH